MNYQIINLDSHEVEELENKLDLYDESHITYKLDGAISIGFKDESGVIAGVDACMTSFKILYVSTVFVDEKYRRRGLGKMLMEEVEKRAIGLGANMIRLDTFDWQGRDFYISIGYEQVGQYTNDLDGFSEYFLLKRL